jgi:type IV fimbrial biogenesis protein FimT
MGIALKIHPSGRYSSGFTMLELVIVIGIFTILMVVGVPSFKYVTTANRISAEVNGLIGDLQYARAEAIKEGQTVVACVSANGTTCSISNSWQNGWIVCSDPLNDGACDAGQPVYRIQNAFTSTDTFVASGNTSTITFNREGFAVGLPGIVTIALHNAAGVSTYTRCLALSAVGTLAVQTVGVGNCT